MFLRIHQSKFTFQILIVLTTFNGYFRQFHLMVCSNQYKDNSAQIIKKYSKHDNRIKYIYKENGGVSSARNLGLTKASGEYVWFVDGDDWIRKGSIRAIGNIITSISEKPDSVLFDSKTVYEYENQQIESEPSYKTVKLQITDNHTQFGIHSKSKSF